MHCELGCPGSSCCFLCLSTGTAGHLKEVGFNALAFNQVANSWVRNVAILNADTAFNMFACNFMTIVSDAVAVAADTGAHAGNYLLA